MTTRHGQRTRRNIQGSGAGAVPERTVKLKKKVERAPEHTERLGNLGTQRLLRRAATPVADAAPSAATSKGLHLGAPDHPLEREADRVADQVTGAPAHGDAGAAAGKTPSIQRVSANATGTAQPAAPPQSVGRVLGSSGQPLAPALQADMGRRFGRDFSGVRVHTGPLEARSAREINARAYTSGQHIVFGEGQFAPGTAQGRKLLAHELTHTVQQSAGSLLQAKLIQRDFALAPTVAAPAEVVLTEAQMRSALQFDQVVFTDAAEIEVVRDVLGIARLPAVVDEAFVNAVLRYQGLYGLTQDGKLGARTAGQLSDEITAEADFLGQPATGTPLRRAARRLHLRSMTSRRLGRLTHQGFVGDDDNPEGAVTVRQGDQEGGATNAISLEYTSENADRVDWLQFINMQMFATPPAGGRVFNTGVVGTTGGNVTWSNATVTNWLVDAVPGGSPLYNVSGGLNTRLAGRRIAMFDEPGGASGLPVAQAFVAAGPAAGATTVTMRMRFDAYVIRNNRARYHVAWTATTTYNTAAGTSSNIVYSTGAAGIVASLRAVHRTALLAEYPGNPIR